jgi:hypothetical protein
VRERERQVPLGFAGASRPSGFVAPIDRGQRVVAARAFEARPDKIRPSQRIAEVGSLVGEEKGASSSIPHVQGQARPRRDDNHRDARTSPADQAAQG